MDFKAVISSLLKRFDEQGLRYGLMGGFALGIWGVARATADLDFLVHRHDLEKVDSVMREMGYECKFRSENVSQYVSPLKVFGEIDYLHAFRQVSLEMLARAEEKDIFGGEMKIRVLRPEDLIGLKLQAIKNNPSRKDIDLWDIKALVASRRDRLDWLRIKQYAELLGSEELLKEFQGE